MTFDILSLNLETSLQSFGSNIWAISSFIEFSKIQNIELKVHRISIFEQ